VGGLRCNCAHSRFEGWCRSAEVVGAVGEAVFGGFNLPSLGNTHYQIVMSYKCSGSNEIVILFASPQLIVRVSKFEGSSPI
jgi:hypothetical protein